METPTLIFVNDYLFTNEKLLPLCKIEIMKDKIAQLMKMESLTTSRLAELLEIQPSAVSHLVSGRNNPRFDLIKRILRRFPRINPDWLLLDDPVMYRDDLPSAAAKSNSELDAVESALFDEDDMLFSNMVTTKPLPKAQKAPMVETSAPHAAVPHPIRVVVLYDDGSFESYSLR